MEYDDVPAPLNPTIADLDNDNTNDDSRSKQRRYWSPKEEEHFFEIWGRDNWKLTKHGKNTLHFANWSQELKDRFNIDVKQEEIQAKVNQTRAKYRQVKKQIENDDMNTMTARWKKYNIITKILSNQYRAKNAEPIPQEALQNNRDIVTLSRITLSPTLTSDSVDEPQTHSNGDDSLLDSNININIYEDDGQKHLYNNELFTDPDDTMKRNYNGDYSYSYDEQSNHYTSTTQEPQLHQLQTPQQQLQQQQHYQTYNSNSTVPLAHPQQHLEAHIQQLQQQQGMLGQNHFGGASYNNQYNNNDNNSSSYNAVNNSGSNNNGGNSNGGNGGNSSSGNSNGSNSYANNNMQPPRSSQSRKRRQSVALVPTAQVPLSESWESIFMEEIRKRNTILQDQRDINEKRMKVEERKLALMEDFFPKCLEMQEKILTKLGRMK